MDFEALFQSLPYIMELFIPGFVFLKICERFLNGSSEHFETAAVYSIVISYIFSLSVELLFQWLQLDSIIKDTTIDAAKDIAALVLASICAIAFVKFKTWGALKWVMRFIGKVTDNNNIWEDIFDSNRGSRIRCYSRFNNNDTMIEGDVIYYENCDDGSCNVAVSNYTITYQNGNIYTPGESNTSAVFYINTRDVHGLEVSYGQTTNNKETDNKETNNKETEE